MTPHPDDTIVALSSAPGPGGRAIVRLTGPRTLDLLRTLTPDAGTPGRITPTHLRLSGVHSTLPADLVFRAGPATATGQDLAELHVVAAPPLIDRLVADLLAAGARSAERGEFTLRAFLAGKKDLPQAEAVLAVIDARTPRQLSDSLTQLAGGVTQPLQALRNDLLDLLADVEAGLDFVGEDIEFVSPDAVLLRVTRGIAHLTNLRRQLDGRTRPGSALRVALVGPPNAGKSSLFNALVGEAAALVSPTPGTTRDYLTASVIVAGIPVELTDTAGRETGRDAIETEAQRLNEAQRRDADLTLDCRPTLDPTPSDRDPTGPETLTLSTKADLTATRAAGIPVSVVTPGGLDRLRDALATTLPRLADAPLASSQSRCRAHVDRALEALRRAHEHARESDPAELLALALRDALDEVAAMAGAVHTDDLLDRVFSRFCIGK
jgi:tRNA modification GTPase